MHGKGVDFISTKARYIEDETEPVSYVSSLLSYDNMSSQEIINSKVYSLEQEAYTSVLSEHNVGRTTLGSSIAPAEFTDTNDQFFIYNIPLSGTHSTGGNVGNIRFDTRDASGSATHTNAEKYVLTSLDNCSAFLTPWDYTYVDRVEVGLLLGNNSLQSHFASEEFLINIYAGSLTVDEYTNEPATWFVDDDGHSKNLEATVRTKNQRARFQNSPSIHRGTRAEIFFTPISTTISDYDDKYFYLSDGFGNKCKFTFNDGISTQGRTGAHDYYIGISDDTTVGHICSSVLSAIEHAAHQKECMVFAKLGSGTVKIINFEYGDHGNQPIENDFNTAHCRFNADGSTDPLFSFTGGNSYDPSVGNILIGSDSYPLNTFSNLPISARDAETTAALIQFDNLMDGGSSIIGTGLSALGKINSSHYITFPASLGVLTGWMARVSIPVKSVFKNRGTPIVAGLKYADSSVPADLDSEGGAVTAQTIYTQSRVYGGRM